MTTHATARGCWPIKTIILRKMLWSGSESTRLWKIRLRRDSIGGFMWPKTHVLKSHIRGAIIKKTKFACRNRGWVCQNWYETARKISSIGFQPIPGLLILSWQCV
jgi:hypothetical protein